MDIMDIITLLGQCVGCASVVIGVVVAAEEIGKWIRGIN
jgi:hypothetical protein